MQNPTVIRTRSRQKASVASKEVPWSFIFLVVLCAGVVAAGFFFAALQHFNSIDYGIKNSKLRDQLSSLEAEKRRLLLAREVALSPMSMRKAAREIGLRDSADELVAMPVASRQVIDAKKSMAVEPTKTADIKKADAPRAVPAVASMPLNPKSNGETRRRIVDPQKEKKEKVEVASVVSFK